MTDWAAPCPTVSALEASIPHATAEILGRMRHQPVSRQNLGFLMTIQTRMGLSEAALKAFDLLFDRFKHPMTRQIYLPDVHAERASDFGNGHFPQYREI